MKMEVMTDVMEEVHAGDSHKGLYVGNGEQHWMDYHCSVVDTCT